MLLFEQIHYKPSIGKSIQGVLKLLKESDNPFTYLESIDKYIRIVGFDYSSYEQIDLVRDLLLDCWSQFLILMKNAKFTQQCVLYEYMSCIMRRAEFCLENWGYSDINSTFSEKERLQLSQYISLLQLSTLFVPRAMITNVSKTREFVFTVLTVSVFRMSEYRDVFFTKLHQNTQHSLVDTCIKIPFAATPEEFINKYINPNLLEEINTHLTKRPQVHPNLTSYRSLYHPELRKNARFDGISQSSFYIDSKRVHKHIPEPIVIRSDQIIYHEEKKHPIEVEFSVDDHSFREIIISQDMSDNPYATTNIQDILRNHHYSLNDDVTPGEPSIELPPLKLPDMSMHIQMMIDRSTQSIEEEAKCRIYERDHPSLFAWEFLHIQPTSVVQYLNMQYVDVLCQTKGLLAQFITFYFSYVHTFSDEEDQICWTAIPGFYILQLIFLTEFQKYHISRLSGGILRMNLNVDKVLNETVANSLCFACCVDGEVLNIILSILFDKCNTGVFLDISRSMQMFFDILQYIKLHHRTISYNQFSKELYDEIYRSYEIKLLLYLQEEAQTEPPKRVQTHGASSTSFSNRLSESLRSLSYRNIGLNSSIPSTKSISLVSESDCVLSTEPFYDEPSHLSKQTSQSPFAVTMSSLDFMEDASEVKEEPAPFISKPIYPAFETNNNSHGISRFNSSQSLLFMNGSSIDRLYASSINVSLMQRRKPHLPPINEIYKSKEGEKSQKSESSTNSKEVNNKQVMMGKAKGFTLLQAIHFLIENNLIFSRGEGFDFFNLLQSHHIFEPVAYNRRFHTTIYHIIPQAKLSFYPYPEISPYSHSLFEDRVNYVYIIYVLKALIKSSHLQIIEKALTFIYYHQDFFNGNHRKMLFEEVLFPHFYYLFTHWSNHIRHIFHRILIYRVFRTRLSFLPGYLSIDIWHTMYERINRHLPMTGILRTLFAGGRSRSHQHVQSTTSSSIWDHDQEAQELIVSAFNKEKYSNTHAKYNETKRKNKIMKTMELTQVRETQSIDMVLMGSVKAKLHILLNIDNEFNPNHRNHKYCIPQNQIQYYWISLLEYVKLLHGYEVEDFKTEPQRIEFNNVYNDGVDFVADTDVLWKEVVEMETPVNDPGADMKYFVTD